MNGRPKHDAPSTPNAEPKKHLPAAAATTFLPKSSRVSRDLGNKNLGGVKLPRRNIRGWEADVTVREKRLWASRSKKQSVFTMCCWATETSSFSSIRFVLSEEEKTNNYPRKRNAATHSRKFRKKLKLIKIAPRASVHCLRWYDFPRDNLDPLSVCPFKSRD